MRVAPWTRARVLRVRPMPGCGRTLLARVRDDAPVSPDPLVGEPPAVRSHNPFHGKASPASKTAEGEAGRLCRRRVAEGRDTRFLPSATERGRTEPVLSGTAPGKRASPPPPGRTSLDR
jgi:hypothetical protein